MVSFENVWPCVIIIYFSIQRFKNWVFDWVKRGGYFEHLCRYSIHGDTMTRYCIRTSSNILMQSCKKNFKKQKFCKFCEKKIPSDINVSNCLTTLQSSNLISEDANSSKCVFLPRKLGMVVSISKNTIVSGVRLAQWKKLYLENLASIIWNS